MIFPYLHLKLNGAVAQLIERVVRNDEVVGLIPICSTIFSKSHATQRQAHLHRRLKVVPTLCALALEGKRGLLGLGRSGSKDSGLVPEW